MTVQKIARENFLEFLNLIKLKGTVETTEILFEAQKDSIFAHTRSIDKSFGLRGVYKGTFEEKEEVGILRFSAFIDYVKELDQDFDLSYKQNKIVLITDKTKVATPMQTRDIIANKLEPEKFQKILDKVENGISFDLNEEVIKDIAKKYSVIPSEEIIIKGKKGKLYLSLVSEEDETKFLKEYDVNIGQTDFAISINKKFVDLLACLKFPVNIKLINNDDAKALNVKVEKSNFRLDYMFSLNDYDETKGKE